MTKKLHLIPLLALTMGGGMASPRRKKLHLIPLLALTLAIGTKANAATDAATDVTSTYLVNPSFEYSASGTANSAQALKAGTDIYGWTIPSTSTGYFNISIGSSSACEGKGFGIPPPAAADYYFFTRHGWNGSGTEYTITTTSATQLVPGTYTMKFNYQGVDASNSSTASKQLSYIQVSAVDSRGQVLNSVKAHKFVLGNKGTNSGFGSTWNTDSVTFTVTSAGTIKFNVLFHYGAERRSDMVVDNFTLRCDSVAITTTDYTDLNSAITNAEARTLGFETGEYAPYNNITPLTALATAKAIDQTAATLKATVDSLVNVLNNSWTVNTEEVNAVYDAHFDKATTKQNGFTIPYGWYDPQIDNAKLGWDVRVVDPTNGKGVTATEYDRALMMKFQTNYGSTTGYTLPLEKGVYELAFIYGGFNEVGARIINFTSGDSITVAPVTASVTAPTNTAHTDASSTSWVNYKSYVTIPTATNYVLNFNKTKDAQNQLVISDIVLRKAVAVDETLSENSTAAPTESYANVTLERTFQKGWNSLVLPFATSTTELGATKAAAYSGTNGTTINFTTVESLKANTPYLVYFDAAPTANLTFSNKVISPSSSLTVADTAHTAQFSFVGTYVAEPTSPIASGDYVVVSSGIQKAAGSNTLKGYRAYLKAVSSSASAKQMIINIDNQVVTGIDAAQIKQAVSANGKMYNLAGQRVNSSYKGIVIKNGKKLINK